MTERLIALVALVALAAAACGAPGGDAAGDGIQVHGHWTIEVFDPDGTLASHTEFENALTSGGEALLSRLLVRDASMGQWEIELLGSPDPHLCPPFGCLIGPPIDTLADSNDIVVERIGNDTVRLSGTVQAVQDGSVRTVNTVRGVCGPTVAPASCLDYGNALSGSTLFTSRTLTAGEVVTASAGQLVQVIVDISFS